jgi:hypothetical protein
MNELERFFAAMWELFIDGCSIDGADLQEAIVKSGLGEHREATAADIGENSDYRIGDDFVALTEAGKRAVKKP